MMSFQEWLNEKYVEWRGKSRNSVTDFANYLGFRQSQVSGWMNGNYKPSTRSVPALADKLGPEIYDVLGFNRPAEPTRITPAELLEKLNPREREAFLLAAAEVTALIQQTGLDPSTPAAQEILQAVFRKHGL